MTDDCEVCGALWRRHALSVARPECPVCEKRICPNCESVRCAQCWIPIHAKCAWMIGEDEYCEKCWDAELRETVKRFGLEQQLSMSLEWAKTKRERAR